MKFETLAIRTQTARGQQKEHSTPIFATSSYVFDDAEEMKLTFADEIKGNVYSRYTNPSVKEFEQKVALMEGTDDARATTTGMAAIFTTFACLLSQGDHVLMSQAVFGSTIKIMENYFQKWGISYTLVNSEKPEEWEQHILPNTKIAYFETPSNPGLQIFDLAAFANLFKKHGIVSIVDNCFATPYLQQPYKFGIDIIIHSATKYMDGQGRVMGGVIAASHEYSKLFEQFMRNAGPTLSPFNAWVLSKSLETLAVRMDRHCENAMELANWLSVNDKVKRVSYPFLPSHPSQAIAMQQMKAGGGMVSFEIDGNLEQGIKVLNSIEMMSMSPNLGDTRSIITHPASTTHSKLTEEQKQMVGITSSLIRISVGLEHIDDIIADLDQALKKM